MVIGVNEMIEARRNAISAETEVELTSELISEFKDSMLECTLNALYNEEETYIMVSEGANIEMTKAVKNRMTEFVKAFDAVGKITNKDGIAAGKQQLEQCLNIINELQNDIEKLDFTVGSAIFGLFVGSFISRIQMIIPNIIVKLCKNAHNKAVNNNMSDYIGGFSNNFLGAFDNINLDSEPSFAALLNSTMKGIKNVESGNGNPEIAKAYKRLRLATVFSNVISWIKELRGLYSIYKRYKAGDSSKEALNLYRNKMLMICNDLKKLINSMIKSYEKSLEEERTK